METLLALMTTIAALLPAQMEKEPVYSNQTQSLCMRTITSATLGYAFDFSAADKACIQVLQGKHVAQFNHYKKFCAPTPEDSNSAPDSVCQSYLAYALMTNQSELSGLSAKWAYALSYATHIVVKQDIDHSMNGRRDLVYEVATGDGVLRCQSRYSNRSSIANLDSYRKALEYDSATTLCTVALPHKALLAAKR